MVVDSDHEEPVPRKARDDMHAAILSIESKVDEVRGDVEVVKDAVREILHINERSKLPMGLYCIMRDALQCKVCLSIPMRPSVIMSKWCKAIIGCEKCVNIWYTGSEALTKNCPACGTERGYSETMHLRGLDTFLTEVRKVILTEEEAESEELPQVVLS